MGRHGHMREPQEPQLRSGPVGESQGVNSGRVEQPLVVSVVVQVQPDGASQGHIVRHLELDDSIHFSSRNVHCAIFDELFIDEERNMSLSRVGCIEIAMAPTKVDGISPTISAWVS